MNLNVNGRLRRLEAAVSQARTAGDGQGPWVRRYVEADGVPWFLVADPALNLPVPADGEDAAFQVFLQEYHGQVKASRGLDPEWI